MFQNEFQFLILITKVLIQDFASLECAVILNFSYTFDQIQDKAETLWRYHLYSIVYDHCYAPRFQFFPLILVHICMKRRCCKTKQADPKFSKCTYFDFDLSAT